MLTPFGELPDRLAGRMSMAEQHDYLHRRVSRRAVLLAGAASPLLWARSAPAAGLPVGPRRLAFGADPSRAVTVSFSTPAAFRQAVVRFGPAATDGTADLDGRGEVTTTAVARISTLYSHAPIEGLTPDTSYRYRVSVDGTEGPGGTFRTAPDGPAPFTFTAFGDQDVSSAAVRLLGQVAAAKPAFHLHAGDLCYADSSGAGKPDDVISVRRWDSWFREIGQVTQSVPWMTAVGNHEMEPGYGDHGYGGYLGRVTVPDSGAPGCPATYAFRYGSVGFVCLDSNDVSYEIPANIGYSGGAQLRWLTQTLADFRRTGSGVDFVVAYFHHCPYSTNLAHGSEGGVRDAWVPVFDQYGVDLVINGHNHCYERTAPLRAGAVTGSGGGRVDSTRGTTYITAGGGGAPLTAGFTSGRALGKVWQADHRSHVLSQNWSLPTGSEKHSVLVADVTPAPAEGGSATLSLRAVDSSGAVLDQVVLSRPVGPRKIVTAATSGADALPWVAGGAAALVAAGGAGAYAVRRYRNL